MNVFARERLGDPAPDADPKSVGSGDRPRIGSSHLTPMPRNGPKSGAGLGVGSGVGTSASPQARISLHMPQIRPGSGVT